MRPMDFSAATKAQLIESGIEIIVTGGGGWLGQATLEMLESCLGGQLLTRVHVFASNHRTVRLRTGTSLEMHPLRDLLQLKVGPHLLANYAFATRELTSRISMAAYVARNDEISQLVTDHISENRPIGMLALSSGAVYLGDDLATNPYGVLKARDERRFLDVAMEARRWRPDSPCGCPSAVQPGGSVSQQARSLCARIDHQGHRTWRTDRTPCHSPGGSLLCTRPRPG